MISTLSKTALLNLLSVSLIMVLITSSNVQAEPSSKTLSHSQQEHSLMGSHGMALIYHKKEGFFASHLALYYPPHNYQIIYKVHVKEQKKLIQLIEKNMITLLPDNFDLSRLIQGESFSIGTQIFQGHFERGGTAVFTSAITFVEPILIKKLSKTFAASSADFYYLPISKEAAIFAHKIQQAPSFDSIGFIDNAMVKLDTQASAGMLKTLTCNKPLLLTAQMIQKQLASCQPFDVKYIEIQDFK